MRINLLAALALVLVSYDVAAACTCFGTPTVDGALKSAEAVFSGKVVSTSNGLARFEVERAWKGVPSARITVLTGPRVVRLPKKYRLVTTWTYCDFEFDKGESYLVYADSEGNYLKAHVCSRTRRLSSAGEDLKQLGEGIRLTKGQGQKVVRRRRL